MKKHILFCLLAMLPFFVAGQVQKDVEKTHQKKPVQQKKVLTTTKVKTDMRVVPSSIQKDPVLEARQKAYNWIAPFKNYGMYTVDQVPTIKSLDLSTGSPTINGVARTYYMCDDSLVHLRAFTGLESLSVTTWMTNNGIEHIAALPNLKALYLTDSEVNNNGIAMLGANNAMETLVLIGTGVTNAVIPMIKQQFPGLRILNIGKTSINDAGLADLLPNNSLENLILNYGNFTDACIPTILQMTNLKLISVQATQVSANGRQQLRDAFPNATIIP